MSNLVLSRSIMNFVQFEKTKGFFDQVKWQTQTKKTTQITKKIATENWSSKWPPTFTSGEAFSSRQRKRSLRDNALPKQYQTKNPLALSLLTCHKRSRCWPSWCGGGGEELITWSCQLASSTWLIAHFFSLSFACIWDICWPTKLTLSRAM